MSNPYPETDYEKWINSKENVLDCHDYPECPLIQEGKHDCMLLYLESGSIEDNGTSFAELCYRICQVRKHFHDGPEQSNIGEKNG